MTSVRAREENNATVYPKTAIHGHKHTHRMDQVATCEFVVPVDANSKWDMYMDSPSDATLDGAYRLMTVGGAVACIIQRKVNRGWPNYHVFRPFTNTAYQLCPYTDDTDLCPAPQYARQQGQHGTNRGNMARAIHTGALLGRVVCAAAIHD